NGIRLLRDEGIAMNPKALLLYKELAWIFFSKMGQYTDDMHMVYKRRWAAEMQRLLAAPPFGETGEVIDAFRPIAEAPLDKDPRRQGRAEIQGDQLKALLGEPAVGGYATLLGRQGVKIDWSLLDAYNRFSLDENVQFFRISEVKIETDRDRAVSSLINDSAHAEARNKLLAFVRAQILWNVYRMDPAWMLALMERHDVPLDWRSVLPHGLYWISYGLEVCREYVDRADIVTLNTDRIALNCLKDLTWTGRFMVVEKPGKADSPDISWTADYRYIDPTHKAYLRVIEALTAARGEQFKDNPLRAGHINYLAEAIETLYVLSFNDPRMGARAREYLEWIKENYEPSGGEWDMGLDDFVIYRLNKGGRPIRSVAEGQITAALQVALMQLVWGKRGEAYSNSYRYARRVYGEYQGGIAGEQHSLPPFAILIRNVALDILVRPRILGQDIPLVDRARFYRQMPPRLQVLLYGRAAAELRRLCEIEGLDFAKAFPPPPGLEEFRRRQLQGLRPAE
ncbi:MAG: hypothetical protein KAU28_11355, partial [Phycisphaerae bacterium]|nr:hypothetical protein [Phycisphaerae bacterium]